MVAAFVADLERLVSRSRLETYRPPDRDDFETVVAYLWNVSLSESLLQCIAAVEIALRNALHTAFTIHTGTEQWFWAVLRGNDLKVVNDRWTKLAFNLKQPPSAGKVIAELTFGFWPFLFEHRYHELWWNDKEAMLNAVFPHLPIGLPPHLKIDRSDILQRLHLFRDLRNRAMHHEPIMFGIARPDLGKPPPIVSLDEVHTQIVEMLAWIDPNCAITLSFVDRFPDVFLNGEAKLRARLKGYFAVL